MQTFSLQPIGIVHSCFKEKFAIPRQPLLAPASKGVIELYAPFDKPEAIEGLESVSHIWLTFIFHKTLSNTPPNDTYNTNEKYLRVRPPRLGGNKKIGVFASRATHRPNPIGQSLVKIDKIEKGKIHISGLDLLDQTPILDIKPYVPYADICQDAKNEIADAPPKAIEVSFAANTLHTAQSQQTEENQLIPLLEQTLAQDPKPAYQAVDTERSYGTQIYNFEVKWRYLTASHIQVTDILPLS